MSSSAENEVTERGGASSKDKNDDKEQGGGGGFIDKVKDFIHDIGEKIEEAVGFGKPTADVCGIHIPHISLPVFDPFRFLLIASCCCFLPEDRRKGKKKDARQ